MSEDFSAFRKMVARAGALLNKIENSALDESKPGYVLNDFGSYDSMRLVDSLLELYSEMLKSEFANDTIRYQYAGFLCRERRYEESIDAYSRVLAESSNPTLIRAAHCFLGACYIRTGNLTFAKNHVESYNQLCEQAGMPFMKTSIEKLSPKRDL